MAGLRRFLLRLYTFLRPARAERELSREVAAHLRFLEEHYARRGMALDEARRAARRAFGGVDQMKEQSRDVRSFVWLEDLRRDLRIGVRTLGKAPGFASVAILTLALGIGATTAIFSVIDGVLLNPLPYPAADRLVQIWRVRMDGFGSGSTIASTTPSELRDTATTLEHVEGFQQRQVVLTSAPRRTVSAAHVTAGFFGLVAAVPVRGRALGPGDPANVVVLRDDLWRQIGDRSTSPVGRTVTIDGRSHLVVGTMPASFRFPRRDTRIWLPFVPAPGPDPTFLSAVGRLRVGATLEKSVDELARLSAGYRNSGAMAEDVYLVPDPLNPFHSRRMGPSRRLLGLASTLTLLLGAVGCVVVIGCANVANLMLSRATGRAREMAVRRALGASAYRLGAYVVTEALVLGGLAGILGAGLAVGSARLIETLMPPGLLFEDIGGAVVSLRALLVVTALSLGTGVLTGAIPALRTARIPTTAVLASAGRTASETRSHVRRALVVAEIALALILLTGASLFVRSFINLQQLDPGFDADRLVVLDPGLRTAEYPTGEASRQFLDSLAARLRAVPGVRAVAQARSGPPQSASGSYGGVVIDAAAPVTLDVEVIYNQVSPEYFSTLGIPLLQGRVFEPADAESPVEPAIVSATLAAAWWPDAPAVGARFRPSYSDEWQVVVGVVGDIRHTDPEATFGPTQLYYPLPQRRGNQFVKLLVNADRPAALLPTLRTETWNVDPRVALSAETVTELVRGARARPRFAVWLMTVFAGVGLLLAAGGVYAVVSYDVSRRTTELGIRMALGATRADVTRLVLRQGVWLVVGGVLLGLSGAFALTRVIEGILFEVTPLDPMIFLSAAGVLASVTFVATYIPARRATGATTMLALRSE